MMDVCDVSQLRSKRCLPCEGGVEPCTLDEARRQLQSLPEWSLSEDGTRLALARSPKNPKTPANDSIRRVTPEQLAARGSRTLPPQGSPNMNPLTAFSVTAMAGTTLWLVMWLTISGFHSKSN